MTLPGLNWRNKDPLGEDAFAIFQAGGFQCAIVMSNVGVGLPVEIARRYPATLLIGRLFRAGGSLPTVEEALAEWRPYVQATWQDIVLYQIDNEPDENYPGISPEDFCAWWVKVYQALAEEFQHCSFGFPMPSVRGQQSVGYLRRCSEGIQAADWLAERGYWEQGWQMRDWHWGARYVLTRTEFPGKPIHLCEYGCSGNISEATRVEQYREYVRTLPDYVQSCHAYIMSGADGWERFWIGEALAQALTHQDGTGVGGGVGQPPLDGGTGEAVVAPSIAPGNTLGGTETMSDAHRIYEDWVDSIFPEGFNPNTGLGEYWQDCPEIGIPVTPEKADTLNGDAIVWRGHTGGIVVFRIRDGRIALCRTERELANPFP